MQTTFLTGSSSGSVPSTGTLLSNCPQSNCPQSEATVNSDYIHFIFTMCKILQGGGRAASREHKPRRRASVSWSPSPPTHPGTDRNRSPEGQSAALAWGEESKEKRKNGRRRRRRRWSEGATELQTHVQGSAGSVASSQFPSYRFYRLTDGGWSCDWTSVSSTQTTDAKTTNQNRSLIPDYVHDSPPPSPIN